MISGCTVRAFDPSKQVERPDNSYLPNIHFYEYGIGPGSGLVELDYTEHITVKSLKEILQLHNEVEKQITYLKMDVEGQELYCLSNWLKSNALKNVDQIGIEIHGSLKTLEKHRHKVIFKGAIRFLQKLMTDLGLYLVDYNPNLLVGKSDDSQKKHYTHHDLLFAKKVK